MVAETISLGILSLPAAVAHLGLVPAIIILLSMGMLASYTGYVIGQVSNTTTTIVLFPVLMIGCGSSNGDTRISLAWRTQAKCSWARSEESCWGVGNCSF